jgi:glyoxylase-like metal-dependent hydrolase (beta-lactamase superfamily II)
MTHPQVSAFFDPETWTVSYVVTDEATRDTIIIDPVLNYDVLASQTSTHSADEIIAFVEKHGLHVRAILETHAHADHMTAARYLARRWSVPIGIGMSISKVQETFAKVFGFDGEVETNGSQFDLLLEGGREYELGSLLVRAIATPGHTPACLSYVIGDAVFTGDALFMHDYGTGRADFPGGSAEDLYASVHEGLYKLPDSTRVFVGHDYQPGGRAPAWETTIGKQKAENVQLSQQTSQAEFVERRNKRDASLRPPRLIYQSIQVNVFGGRLPAEGKNGKRYLKTPLNLRVPTDDLGEPKKKESKSASAAE